MFTVPLSGVLSSAGFFSARHLKTIMSIKLSIAALAAAPLLASGAAFAGPYVNVESNLAYPDGDYSNGTTDLHVGYEGSTEKVSYYVQAGPAFVHTDSTDDTESEISGKVGASVAVSDDLSVYGEIAGITGEASSEDIIDWSGKIGAKFTF